MTLTIRLSPALERQLRAEAARLGQTPEEFARQVLEERLTGVHKPRGGGLAALMDEWRQAPPDLEEAEGYPEQIEPLRLREVTIE